MRDSVGAAGGVELVEQRADMKLDGMDGDAELARDHLVRGALGHQRQHVELAWRQRDVAGRRRAVPVAQDDRGRLSWRREPQTGNTAEQQCQPVCKDGVVDLQGEDDLRRGLLAHASGLSPIVTLKLAGSPPRRTATSTIDPMLSGPSVRDRARTPDNFSLLTATMTSPCRMPAAADGPALSTFITIA